MIGANGGGASAYLDLPRARGRQETGRGEKNESGSAHGRKQTATVGVCQSGAELMPLARPSRLAQYVHVTKIFDISMPVATGGVIYPGNPPIQITPASELSKGDSSNLSLLSFGSHTGTHIDAPRHFFDAGTTVDRLSLNALIGPAEVVTVGSEIMAVTADMLRPYELHSAERVLIRTRNSGFINDPTFHQDYTYLAPDGAEYLASLGVKLVGVDYLSIEQFHSGHHKTHRTLLERGVIIVEGLDLSAVGPGSYAFCCLPLKLVGLDGAPARAVLWRTD